MRGGPLAEICEDPRVRFLAPLAAVVVGCGAPSPPASRALEGRVAVPEGAIGNAYVFLYEPGEGPPAKPAVPELATAVSAVRLQAGDPHFVFASVPDGPHRLWGFLDRDRSVRLDVDVLAQPGAGDLVSRGLELAGRTVPEPLVLDVPTPFDPPAFEIAGAESLVVLPDQPLLPVRFSVQTTRLSGRLDQVAFAVSQDAFATFYPRVAFRFLAKPGQAGEGALLPCFIESQLQLQQVLGGDPARIIPLDQLPLAVLPFAVDAAGAQLPAIPVGEYQLVAVEQSGQVWTLPNGLAGAEPSQATRFFVQHALFASGLP
jgi:hypothetical protein